MDGSDGWHHYPEEKVADRLQRVLGEIEDSLKQLPTHQSKSTQLGLNMNPPSPPPATTPPQAPRIHTKPRDIPILELHQLEGMEATAHLQMFIELVEQVTDDDSGRVTVAKSRLGSEIAMLVHNKQQKERSLTWRSLCKLLETEFTLDINLDRAWQDLETLTYEFEDSPQAFSNRFLCKYAVLETKFPKEQFPHREKTVKRLIWHGLPKELKDRVEAFLDEDYPLARFLDRVEYQRQMYLQTHLSNVNRVKEKNPPKGTRDLPPQDTTKGLDSPTPSHLEKIDRLERQVKALTAQLERMPPVVTPVSPPPMFHPGIQPLPRPQYQPLPRPQYPPPKYCPYCRNNSHNLRDCKRVSPSDCCWDCGRLQCRRGSPNCPGKRQNNI